MVVHNVADKSGYDQMLKDHSDKLVIVDCFATWCPPCKAIAPVLVTWSDEDAFKNVHFAKLDIDQVPEVAQELGVRAMPTFYLFKNGEKVDEFLGAQPAPLKAMLTKHNS